MSAQIPPPNGTTLYRVERLEAEQLLQRDRIHTLINELAQLRLALQHATDKITHLDDRLKTLGDDLGEDVRSVKRAFNTLTVGAVGASIVFAFSAFSLFGGQ